MKWFLYFIFFLMFALIIILVPLAIVLSNKYDKEHPTNRSKPKKQNKPKGNVCPGCLSERIRLISVYDKVILNGITKTTYTANLNPLKPFTLVNKKDKTVVPEIKQKTGIYQCEKCMKTFERAI